MDGSFANTVQEATHRLMVQGELDDIPEFFTPGYVAHLTDQEIRGHQAPGPAET